MDIAWAVLDSQWRGVAQRRNRVFFVVDFRETRCAEILFEPESVRGDSAPSREKREEIAGTIGGSSQSGGFRTTDLDNNGAFVVGAVSSKWAKGTGGPSGDECQNLVTHSLSAEGADASEDGTGRGTPLVVAPLRLSPYADNASQESQLICAFSSKDHGADAQNELAPTLRSMNFDKSHLNGGGQVAVAFEHNQNWISEHEEYCPPLTNSHGGAPAVAFQTRIARNGRGQPEEIAPALSGADCGATSDMRPCVQTGMSVRRLTPRECERLQGFPDDWTRWDAQEKEISDSARYRMLGNAVTVTQGEWIGSQLVKFK